MEIHAIPEYTGAEPIAVDAFIDRGRILYRVKNRFRPGYRPLRAVAYDSINTVLRETGNRVPSLATMPVPFAALEQAAASSVKKIGPPEFHRWARASFDPANAPPLLNAQLASCVISVPGGCTLHGAARVGPSLPRAPQRLPRRRHQFHARLQLVQFDLFNLVRPLIPICVALNAGNVPIVDVDQVSRLDLRSIQPRTDLSPPE